MCATMGEPRRTAYHRYCGALCIIPLSACLPACLPICLSGFLYDKFVLPVCRNRGNPTSSRHRCYKSRRHTPDELFPRRKTHLVLFLLLASITHVHAHANRPRHRPRWCPNASSDRTCNACHRRSERGATDSCTYRPGTCRTPPKDESIT